MKFPCSTRYALACLFANSLFGGGFIALDRWQRHTIFSVELGEARWARDAPAGTEQFDRVVSGGETVRLWFLPAQDPDAATVLYLHGSRWNLNSSVFRIERWRDMGYNVLAVDYRGFGESSPGLPSQKKAREDAQAALQELIQRQPDPSKRFVYGHSLGGAIAIDLAATDPTNAFAGLIIESSFTRIRDMIATTRWADLPGLPWLVTQPFDSLESIGRVQQPTLFLHGTADHVVPHTMSDRLHEQALQRNGLASTLVKLEHASHSGASRHEAYAQAVNTFTRESTTWKLTVLRSNTAQSQP